MFNAQLVTKRIAYWFMSGLYKKRQCNYKRNRPAKNKKPSALAELHRHTLCLGKGTPKRTCSEPHPSPKLGENTSQSCYFSRILVICDEIVKERQCWDSAISPIMKGEECQKQWAGGKMGWTSFSGSKCWQRRCFCATSRGWESNKSGQIG